VAGAQALLLIDVALLGSYLCSGLVCPIWLFVSLLKNAIQRTPSRTFLFRVAMPGLTLAIVLVNDSIQSCIAETNAAKIITACEQFNEANGRYPKSLNELIPEYLPSIPRAKYCLFGGGFHYWNSSS
jgi:hypothetical protein